MVGVLPGIEEGFFEERAPPAWHRFRGRLGDERLEPLLGGRVEAVGALVDLEGTFHRRDIGDNPHLASVLDIPDHEEDAGTQQETDDRDDQHDFEQGKTGWSALYWMMARDGSGSHMGNTPPVWKSVERVLADGACRGWCSLAVNAGTFEIPPRLHWFRRERMSAFAECSFVMSPRR